MAVDYSIIIPAYNEEKLLANTLSRLQQSMAEIPLQGEIIVTNNNSTDSTGDIAKAAGVRVVFEPVNQISRARNTGAKHAQGRYFIFIDADTYAPPALLQAALDNMLSGNCCGGGANIWPDSQVNNSVSVVLNTWNAISRTFRLAAGCFVYCRRDDFEACGGFSENVYATEEIWFSMALKRIGRKSKRKFCVISEPRAITSSRKLVWYSQAQQLKLLIIMLLFPFLMRYKWACGFWYQRPGNNN